MTAFFVTGAGTDIGKTFLATRYIAAWRAAGLAAAAIKPVISGFDPAAAADSDSGRLLAALGREVSTGEIGRISPWRYAAPLSPDMAAAREGRRIPWDGVVTFCRAAAAASAGRGARLLIEGIGGVMVPLDADRTVRDLIAAVGVPAILVGGSYVGGLSHALSAFEALRACGVAVDRIVVSEVPDSAAGLGESCATLRRFTDGVRVDPLPFGGDAPAP